MATPTYDLLDSVTLASSATSVVFSSIDTSYGDLILIAEADQTIRVQFNSDTGSNYYYVLMYGDGSSTYSIAGSYTSITAGNANYACITQIMDYAATDKHKCVLNRRNSDLVMARGDRWANTSAITSITIFSGGTAYSAGGTFNLYGVAK